MTRLPRVLSGTMQELRRLHPIEQSVDERLTPLSTVSMTLDNSESVSMHDWVEIYTDAGSAGNYRVRKVSNTYTVESSAELEHGICALGDAIIPGKGTLSGTRSEVLTAMLGHQVLYVGGHPLWKIGSVSDNSAVEYEYDNTNLLSAVLEIVPETCKLVFDQSTLPWKIGMAYMETAPSCEGRITRNLRSVTVTIDDEDLCTRIYCDKLPEPHYMDGPNIATWGVKIKTITAQDNVTQESLIAYIAQYLEDHKDPRISIEIDADDLANVTGESIDRFEIGRLFRLALPDYGVTMEERILAVRHASAFGDPEHVKLTLANSVKDTADTMVHIDKAVTGGAKSSRARSGSLGSRGTGLSQTSVLDMLKKTETYITADEAWTREAGVKIESNSAELYATKKAIVGNWTEDVETINALIQASSDNGGLVAMLVGRKNSAEEVNALISATAAGGGLVTIKASQTDLDAMGERVSSAEASIKVNSDNIELKVSKNGVISSINQTAESVKIKASKIELSGYVTASQLSSLEARFDNLTSGVTQAALINTQNLMCNGPVTLRGHSCDWSSLKVCTDVHYSKEANTIPATDGLYYYVITSVKVWGDYETINFMSY